MRYDMGTGDGVTGTGGGGGPAWLAKQFIYVTWIWPSNAANPSWFEIVTYTGTDPTQTDTYVFDQKVPGTERHLQMVVTPSVDLVGIKAAVRAIYE